MDICFLDNSSVDYTSEDLDSNQTSSQVLQPRPSSKSLSISENSLELSFGFFLLPNVRLLFVMYYI